MADIIADFAVETSSTTGTGTYSLAGAVSGLRTIVAALGTGVTGEFVARTASYSKWERFRGVITDGSPDTLTRAEILESSNANTAVDWQAGDAPIYIHCIVSAARVSQLRAHHRGATAPANPLQPGMIWVDTTGGVTALVWKFYTAALAWVTLFTQNESTGVLTFGAAIVLSGNPTSALHAAPKQYVDQGDRQSIWGLTYANNGSDATNDIDIAVGGAMDSTGADWLALASALTKRLDANWAVGTNQGGILSGSAANVDYNIWLIKRVDTGVVDVGFETTANATPTLPSNYTLYRKIGWFKRVSATIVPFTTFELPGGGLQLMWVTPTIDKDVSTLSTTRITDAAKVPLDLKTLALLRTAIGSASATTIANVCDPAEADQAPSITASPGATHYVSVAGGADVKDMEITTSATGTVAARASAASTTYRFWTRGFRWSRR